MDDPVAAAPEEPLVIERGERLSRSMLWTLERAYFERVGVDAWRTGEVPHYITSNPFIAAAYARVAVGFLRDVVAAGARTPGEPLTIVELGAGSGRFAYHFLRKLLAEPRIPLLQGAAVRYVMTDVAPANLAFWREHPQLRRFIEAGVLDMALFDVERDDTLRLQVAGTTLAAGAAGPLVGIANYLFDCLPQDAYLLRDGRLHESRVTLTAPGAGPPALGRVSDAYEHVAVEGEPDVDPDFRFLVDEYRSLLGEGAFDVPTGALACVRALARLSGGSFLLLSADRGYCHEEELTRRAGPELARHGNVVSLPVNYHAIGRYVERLGGRAIFPPRGAQSLCVGAFLLGAPSGGLETAAAFAAVSGFGPDEWFTLKKGVEAARGEMGLSHLVAALRLGGPDGKLLMDVFDQLVNLAPEATDAERRACLTLAREAWDLHYDLGEERDLAFHLGVWMRELGYLEEAIRYFDRARARSGATATLAYNLAFCHFGQQRNGEALRWIEAALAASPDLPGARALRIDIRAALRDDRQTPRDGAVRWAGERIDAD